MLRFLLTKERWEETRRDDIEIDGLQASLPVLGLLGLSGLGSDSPG
jgi:hypothetical protein